MNLSILFSFTNNSISLPLVSTGCFMNFIVGVTPNICCLISSEKFNFNSFIVWIFFQFDDITIFHLPKNGFMVFSIKGSLQNSISSSQPSGCVTPSKSKKNIFIIIILYHIKISLSSVFFF